MIYAILAVLFSSTEMMMFGHVLPMFHPLFFVCMFYFSSSIMILLLNRKLLTDLSCYRNKDFIVYITTSGIGNILWFLSIYQIGVSSVVIISLVQRLFILFYSVFKMNEKMSYIQILLSVIVLLSTLLFATQASPEHVDGILISAAAFIFYSVSDIFQKKISSVLNWDVAVFHRQFSQFIVYFLLTLVIFIVFNIDSGESFSLSAILWVLAISLIGGVLSKICHFKAIKDIGLSRYIIVEQLKPVLVFLAGVFLLNENISSWQIFAGIIILTSMIAIFSLDKKETPPD